MGWAIGAKFLGKGALKSKSRKKLVVLVTGSTRHIGKAIAIQFAESGALVVLNARRDSKESKSLLAELRAKGLEVDFFSGDMTKERDIKKVFSNLKRKHRRLDVLINNVGGGPKDPKDALNAAFWSNSFQLNLFSAVSCTSQALKMMENQKSGVVIQIASVRGLFHAGHPHMMAYSAAKAALLHFTATLAKVVPAYIHVAAIAPGKVTEPAIQENLENTQGSISPEAVAREVFRLAQSPEKRGGISIVDKGFHLL
jgi:3-oxoacyl-[acyl-carrier protein] reductase